MLSPQVVQELSSNVVVIEKLENFQYKDKNGKDFGENVRHRAKQLAELIIDPDRIREERRKVRRGATPGHYSLPSALSCKGHGCSELAVLLLPNVAKSLHCSCPQHLYSDARFHEPLSQSALLSRLLPCSQAKELKSKYTGVSSDAMRGRSRTSASGGLGSSGLSGSGYAWHTVHVSHMWCGKGLYN